MQRWPEHSTPHFLFVLDKKKTGRGRSKRKNRFGGSGCASASLHAAGGGWLAIPRGSQGRKRVPLGDDVCPGKSRILFSPLSAGTGLVVCRASASIPVCQAPIDRQGSEQAGLGGQAFRQPPRGLRQSGNRGARPAQRTCPARAGRRPANFVGTYLEQLPHLSKPAHMRRFCAKRFFLLDRPRPVLFLSRTKREWGVDCQTSILVHAPVPSDGLSQATTGRPYVPARTDLSAL